MAREESILGQDWPTTINPVLFSNESRACIRERARAEELVLLARSWTTSYLGRISLSPHDCSLRTRAASPGCLHWGKFAWNFNLPSDEKCVSTGTRSGHRLPNERMTFSLMGQFLGGEGQRAWGSPQILEGSESQEFTTDSQVSQVKCSSELQKDLREACLYGHGVCHRCSVNTKWLNEWNRVPEWFHSWSLMAVLVVEP